MSYCVTIDQFARLAASLDKKVEKAVIKGLRSSALRLQGLVVEEIDSAKPYPAVDRSDLRNSHDHENTQSGAIVFMTAPHAGIIEWGTRPFRPPLQPLIEWALRKGLAADEGEAKAIAWGIASRMAVTGIAPRGYFAKAVERLTRDGILNEEINDALDELARSGA